MTTSVISIDSMEKVRTFVSILNECNGHFDLISGCCKVNAKSIMGIFSLDISQPLCLNIYNDEYADDILKSLCAYGISS